MMEPLSQRLVKPHWLEHFAATGSGRLRMISNSMAPLLKAGDTITVSRIAPGQIRMGDLIVFQQQTGLVTHRAILSIRRTGTHRIYERSDRYGRVSRIPADQVLGRVKEISRGPRSRRLDRLPLRLLQRVYSLCVIAEHAVRRACRRAPGGRPGLQKYAVLPCTGLRALCARGIYRLVHGTAYPPT